MSYKPKNKFSQAAAAIKAQRIMHLDPKGANKYTEEVKNLPSQNVRNWHIDYLKLKKNREIVVSDRVSSLFFLHAASHKDSSGRGALLILGQENSPYHQRLRTGDCNVSE